jgi:hypothetical protein
MLPARAARFKEEQISSRQMLLMELKNSHNLYLMMMYVYLKAYREALMDFEVAVKDSSYVDMALMSVQQKYKEKIERIERELS